MSGSFPPPSSWTPDNVMNQLPFRHWRRHQSPARVTAPMRWRVGSCPSGRGFEAWRGLRRDRDGACETLAQGRPDVMRVRRWRGSSV